MNQKKKIVLEAIFILFLFVLVSYFVQTNFSFFENLASNFKEAGIFIYLILIILGTILAPISTIPLIPIISLTYGWFIAGLIAYFGWLLASIIIFYISRKFGKPLVKKIVSLKSIESLEESISKEKELTTLILLRMTLPVDIASYGLGLFSNASWKSFILSSVIGLIPFTFLIAYFGSLPLFYQILGGIFLVIILILGFVFRKSAR